MSARYLAEARAGLVRHFGWECFRPGQEEVIGAVLSGRNVVVVMPTGAGKSLCYQLPATLLPGVTLVVSPLIALMKDQVEQLVARGIGAAFINSTLSDAERAERLQRLRERAYKLVYAAPERLRSPAFLEALAEAGVDLFAVDEAHCISQWGHDFRPDYALLGKVRQRLRPPRTVALTATATPEVRQDIARCLLMKDPQVFVAGFDRPDLFLEVTKVSGEAGRRAACARLAAEGGPGLVYCATRKAAEGMHRSLKEQGHDTVLYHAGLQEDARRRAQDTFMASRRAVAVATCAFGMGIDKPDIRFVAHANIPRAVEAYYQEIGRAGRDGRGARAVLLFNHADVFTQERLIRISYPPAAVFADTWAVLQQEPEFDRGVALLAAQIGTSEPEVSAVLKLLEREGKLVRSGRGEGAWGLSLRPKAPQAHPGSSAARALLALLLAELPAEGWSRVQLPALAQRSGLKVEEVRHALALLERAGALEVHRPFSGRTIRTLERVPFEQLGLDLARVRELERRSLLLLRRMTDYAYWRQCRRAFILRYFGEQDVPSSCGACDVCAGPRRAVCSEASAPAPPGTPPVELHSALAVSELKRWRRDLARDVGVPPYLIFNDATLLALATALPLDRESFLKVKGTGEARWERFGPKVVEVSLLARAAGHVPAPAAVARSRR